ncbi:MAG: RNA pseudouridine synthase [Clostridiales bacterium]|nr:MAG: RNA pseudouridine synthase [Clostridiales bacterium]
MVTGTYNQLIYRVEQAGKTIRQVLFEDIGISSRLYRQLKPQRTIMVNGHVISLNAKARPGDVIVVNMVEKPHRIQAEAMPLDIVYEDCDIVAVNKQFGVVAHPTLGVPNHTLSNALRHYALQKGEDYKPRLINRLDRDTTGIILFAKNPHAQNVVSQAFIDGAVEKYYMALVHGKFNKSRGTIEGAIGLAEGSNIKRTVRDDGKYALTHYQLIRQLTNCALLKVQIKTGRTHQIRVHMSHIGHPIVGDDLYGSFERVAIKRQALHAAQLHITTPRSGRVTITAALPNDFERALAILE